MVTAAELIDRLESIADAGGTWGQLEREVALMLADAEQRGREAELSAVKAYLDEMGETTLADHLEHGLHHPEGAADE